VTDSEGLRILCEELSHALSMLINDGAYRGKICFEFAAFFVVLWLIFFLVCLNLFLCYNLLA